VNSSSNFRVPFEAEPIWEEYHYTVHLCCALGYRSLRIRRTELTDDDVPGCSGRYDIRHVRWNVLNKKGKYRDDVFYRAVC
jgi:hypothetical protein